MPTITAEQFKAPPLRRAEVYLDRFKGSVILQELTGDQVLLAAQWSLEQAAGTEGLRIMNPAKRRRLQIACALVEPKLAEEPVVAGEVLKGWPALEQLLLVTVVELLDAGLLTDEQKVMLAAEGAAAEKVEALGLSETPEGLVNALSEGEDLEALLKVAHVPGVMSGQMSMTVVRLLAESADRQREALAEAIARRLTEAGSG